jgi:hypothetical protein
VLFQTLTPESYPSGTLDTRGFDSPLIAIYDSSHAPIKSDAVSARENGRMHE